VGVWGELLTWQAGIHPRTILGYGGGDAAAADEFDDEFDDYDDNGADV
jgi:hypothetical protein